MLALHILVFKLSILLLFYGRHLSCNRRYTVKHIITWLNKRSPVGFADTCIVCSVSGMAAISCTSVEKSVGSSPTRNLSFYIYLTIYAKLAGCKQEQINGN